MKIATLFLIICVTACSAIHVRGDAILNDAILDDAIKSIKNFILDKNINKDQ